MTTKTDEQTLAEQEAGLSLMAEAGEEKLNAYLDHRTDLGDQERAEGDLRFMDFIMKMRVHRQLLKHARRPIH